MLTSSALLRAVKGLGVSYVVCVPDTMTRALYAEIEADAGLRLIRATREDEGIGIALGLWVGGAHALLLIQNTGVFAAVNALRGLGVDYALPLVMVVGLLGREPGVTPRRSANALVRNTEPLLDLLGLEHALVEDDADLEAIATAGRIARERERPYAVLIGTEVTTAAHGSGQP